MRHTTKALALGSILSLVSATATAGTATSNLSVTASVAANCLITTSPVAFGSYDPVGTHASTVLDGTGSVTVTCTKDAPTTITLGQGSNADEGSSDAAPIRRLASGGNYLVYSLYQDIERQQEWGNTGERGVPHLGTGTAVELTIYGTIFPGQNVPSGEYSDVVVATVTF